MSEHWTNRFVGLPFAPFGRSWDGIDCWGLARLVYREQLNVVLPDYLEYTSVDEHAEIAALVAGAKDLPSWRLVDGLAVPFDIVVFRRGRQESHIGLVVHDGLMLHASGDDCSKIESYRSGLWTHRLAGTFRHLQLCSEEA